MKPTTVTADNRPLKDFRVRVGHWEIPVRVRDEEEAVLLARRHLSRELPRLYDVIRAMTPARFQVEDAA